MPDPYARPGFPILGADRIESAIRSAKREKVFALAPFLTAGYPDLDRFPELFRKTVAEADIVELGIPFTDPIADGPTIQRSSQIALESGVSIPSILNLLSNERPEVPTILMSYLNPLLAYGFDRFANDCASVGVCGIIVPDMPIEESQPLTRIAQHQGLCVIRMVSPVTPDDRLKRICTSARGFIYATTICGTTGADHAIDQSVEHMLSRVREHSSIPVLAGFGIRTSNDATRIARHCDGVIIGSALIEAIDQGQDPAEFLREIRHFPAGTSEMAVASETETKPDTRTGFQP
jgi:tryptophan synthase alpha chain